MTTPEGNQATPAGATATALAGPASFQLDATGSAVSISHKTFWGLAWVRGSFTKLSPAHISVVATYVRTPA